MYLRLAPSLALLALFLQVGIARGAEPPSRTVRVATFNVALAGKSAGDIARRLSRPGDPQARAVAEIIQRVRPDVLLLNELDYDDQGQTLALFEKNYLAISSGSSRGELGPAEPIHFPYRFVAPVNTGISSGHDLDNDGQTDDSPGDATFATDAQGYGWYPGQYGMAVLSKFPLNANAIRTFQNFLWKDLPGARLPDDPHTPSAADWFDKRELLEVRLSSKSHWDLPIRIGGSTLHFLVSHPTPPVFDGPEDRNGLRNHDEIRFWTEYIARPDANWIQDDAGVRGGLSSEALFVIAGDLNCDPLDGQSTDRPIRLLLESPRVAKSAAPRSPAGTLFADSQGGANRQHRGDPGEDTSELPDDPGPGNLRLDYVLPSSNARVVASGVFWPAPDDPLFPLVAGAEQPASSDHRLVWIDLYLPDSP